MRKPSYVTIPYRFNRAIFLNGHRFHQTDALHFAPCLDAMSINLRRRLRAAVRAPVRAGVACSFFAPLGSAHDDRADGAHASL